MLRPLAMALAALALAGCGSRDVADYPPPAALPGSPGELADLPGDVRVATRPELPVPADRIDLVLDRRRSTLTAGGRTVRTPLEPVAAARVPGGPVLVVGGRERVLAAYDARTLREVARVPAGAGPTDVVAADGLAFVADTTGRALLVFRTAPELQLVHRGALPGAPWALALDAARERIWVTIPPRNRVLAFAVETRPERLQGFATVRSPRDVAVAGRRIAVTGERATQLIDPERD